MTRFVVLIMVVASGLYFSASIIQANPQPPPSELDNESETRAELNKLNGGNPPPATGERHSEYWESYDEIWEIGHAERYEAFYSGNESKSPSEATSEYNEYAREIGFIISESNRELGINRGGNGPSKPPR